VTLALSLALGLLIGAVLGALGGGGAILTVPLLVYVLGQTAQQATASSLVIVGVTAVAGAAGHARAGNVRWGTAASFGVTGIAAAYAGTALNTRIDPHVLLIGFALVMLLAAAGMLLRSRREIRAAHPPSALQPSQEMVAAGAAGTSTAQLLLPQARPVSHIGRRPEALRVLAAGLAVGFMTGLFGVGGGFVIVPALTLAVGLPMPVAAGTSLLIIALNSGTALVARAGSAHFDWAVIVPFTGAAIAGTILGRGVAGRVPHATLNRAFAVLLMVVAVYLAIQNILALR
jgi:uncharacterized membrane protein YfcA